MSSSPLPLSITGSPISTGSAPTGSAPGSLTVFVTPPVVSGADATSIYASLADGSSITLQAWLWLGGVVWTKLGAAIVISAPLVVSSGVVVPRGGATVTMQVTAAAGNPTSVSLGWWGLS